MQVRDNITSCWNFLNLCGFNNSGYMLSPTGQSSRNTDSPQRNQPSVATTSWSREWNHAQGELFSLFILDTHVQNTAHPALVWAVSFSAPPEGMLLFLLPVGFLGTLKWVNLTLTTVFDFYFYLVLFAISAVQFSVLFKKKRLKRSCWKNFFFFFRLWVFGVIGMFLMVFPNRISRYTGTGTM